MPAWISSATSEAAPTAPAPAWTDPRRFGRVRVLCFVLCGTPGLWLLGEWLCAALGPNPLNRLLHFTGWSAAAMLAATLSVTPLRRLSVRVSQAVHARYGKRWSDWNWLLRLRRQVGLYAAFYASLHVALYLRLDLAVDLQALPREFLADAGERPFVLLGLLAYLLLLPLALTSFKAAMRRLGRWWSVLHTLVYAVAVLALAHAWLQTKVGHTPPWGSAALLGLLLATRLRAWRRGERGAPQEVRRR